VGNWAAYISPTVENPIKIFDRRDDEAIFGTSFTMKKIEGVTGIRNEIPSSTTTMIFYEKKITIIYELIQ